MKKAFDLLAKLPEDFLADERQDTPPQERADMKIGRRRTGVLRGQSKNEHGKIGEEN
ncbi:MAG TPA: hypothetical protein VMF56_13160 [Acidobacteriaceae bacterium]|nr:hypothetical protein [Acidobacteriaceae bacterium]